MNKTTLWPPGHCSCVKKGETIIKFSYIAHEQDIIVNLFASTIVIKITRLKIKNSKKIAKAAKWEMSINASAALLYTVPVKSASLLWGLLWGHHYYGDYGDMGTFFYGKY